jgi:hypothetical protein
MGLLLALTLELAFDAQYYQPTRADRQIDSVFLDAMAGAELFAPLHLAGYAGLTATYASGFIVQSEGTFDTQAAGLGPILLLRLQPLSLGPLSLGADGVASLILYNHHFPPGGDVYNFSLRAGPSLRVRLGGTVDLLAGWRWMHVSNGQGLGSWNPSYVGRGPSLGAAIRLP